MRFTAFAAIDASRINLWAEPTVPDIASPRRVRYDSRVILPCHASASPSLPC